MTLPLYLVIQVVLFYSSHLSPEYFASGPGGHPRGDSCCICVLDRPPTQTRPDTAQLEFADDFGIILQLSSPTWRP